MYSSNKPAIAVFSYAYYPFEGGAEIAARQIMKRLKEFQFVIFTQRLDSRWLDREIDNNVEIVRLGRGRVGSYYGRIWEKVFFIFRAFLEAEKFYQKKRFEAIWAIMASYGGIAALFFKLRHPNVPLLLTLQEGDSERHLRFGQLGLVGFWARRIIKKSDAIQVISNYLRDWAKKCGAHCSIEIIPNGVDEEFFQAVYTPTQLKSVREELGLKDDYVIVTSSRLVFKNGIDILLRIVAKFKERRPNVKLVILGDGPEKGRLRELVKDLRIENNVVWVGQVAHRDLPIYLGVADMFIRPSRSEGLGSSFLEAMAIGLPVIGTRVGGITDFLIDLSESKDGATGLLVPPEDPDAVLAAMNQLVENPHLKEILVRNAKKLVVENYNWEVVSRLFKNLFDRLINL